MKLIKYAFVLLFFTAVGPVRAEMHRSVQFDFAGEKKMVFMTPNKDKTWDVKLLDESAGSMNIYFDALGENGANVSDEQGKEVGRINYFGISKSPAEGRYFVAPSDHVQLSSVKEKEKNYYVFEGMSNQGLRVEGYLKVDSVDFPKNWQFNIKAITPEGVTFYEINELKSEWAREIFEANSPINMGYAAGNDE